MANFGRAMYIEILFAYFKDEQHQPQPFQPHHHQKGLSLVEKKSPLNVGQEGLSSIQ